MATSKKVVTAQMQISEVVHGSLVKGKFEDTLETFFNDPTLPKAGMVNLDADLYSSTIERLLTLHLF